MKKLRPGIIPSRLLDAVETENGMELTFAPLKKNGRISLDSFKIFIPFIKKVDK